METVFQNDIFHVLFALLTLYMLALISTLVMLIINIEKKRNAKKILQTSMVIKWIHVPAYFLIFIIGVICSFTIFTYAITILLMILDSMTIVLTGTLGVCGIVRGAMEKKLSKKAAVLHAVLQFVFCIDIISAIVVYIKVKKSSLDTPEHQ